MSGIALHIVRSVKRGVMLHPKDFARIIRHEALAVPRLGTEEFPSSEGRPRGARFPLRNRQPTFPMAFRMNIAIDK